MTTQAPYVGLYTVVPIVQWYYALQHDSVASRSTVYSTLVLWQLPVALHIVRWVLLTVVQLPCSSVLQLYSCQHFLWAWYYLILIDGDSVQNFVNALDNYYDLMNLRGSNQQARYAEALLTDKACTQFAIQSYDLQTLVQNTLKSDLLVQFRPADYMQQAHQQLLHTRQNSPDVADYIARFNLEYNRCSNVSEEEAKFLFKENLWSEISVQMLSAQPSTLKDSQSAAQLIGNVLHNASIFSKGGKRKKNMRPWLDRPFNP